MHVKCRSSCADITGPGGEAYHQFAVVVFSHILFGRRKIDGKGGRWSDVEERWRNVDERRRTLLKKYKRACVKNKKSLPVFVEINQSPKIPRRKEKRMQKAERVASKVRTFRLSCFFGLLFHSGYNTSRSHRATIPSIFAAMISAPKFQQNSRRNADSPQPLLLLWPKKKHRLSLRKTNLP